MPVVSALNNDGSFGINLPASPSADQIALRARFLAPQPTIIFKRGIPGYETLPARLYAAAQLAFDGVAGNPPDTQSALLELGEITAELKRLDARPGRFVVELPPRTDQEHGRDIGFRLVPGTTAVPADQLSLKADIEDTLTTLEVILPPQQPRGWFTAPIMLGRFDQYRTKLYSLAQVGLQGDADPQAAQQALTALHTEILRREGPRVKNGYMKVLGAYAAGMGFAAFAVYLILHRNVDFSIQITALRNLLLVWTGTMIGTWLSFGVRRTVLTVSDLSNLEADMVEPSIRLIFTGLIATTICFMFICGLVNVAVGDLKSANLLAHGTTAMLIGMLLGVSEQALPGALTRRASQFVTEVAGR